MEQRQLNVDIKTSRGKGTSRKIRQAGKVPGVFYGRGKKSVSLTVDPKLLKNSLNTKSGVNTLLQMVCDSEELNGKIVMLKDYQVHPLTEVLLHVDFLEIDIQRELEVNVRIVLQGTPAGVTLGGNLEHQLHELIIKTLPMNIPDEIFVDVTELQLGHAIHVSDIKIAEGIKIITPLSEVIASVVAPKILAEAAVAAEEGEEAEAAEGTEGAADKKAPADKKGSSDKS